MGGYKSLQMFRLLPTDRSLSCIAEPDKAVFPRLKTFSVSWSHSQLAGCSSFHYAGRLRLNAMRALGGNCIPLILRVHLDVPDQRFWSADLEEFGKRQRDAEKTLGVAWSPWTLLAVSKLWRAAGEPLLYQTVVVRSQSQAHALMLTLRERPELGSYVRRLRLEGAFGLPGGMIIHLTAATVVDLWLNVGLFSCAPGMLQTQAATLSWLSPERVLLHSVASAQMRPYVLKALESWPRVVRRVIAQTHDADQHSVIWLSLPRRGYGQTTLRQL